MWLSLILTINCFVSPLVENENDAGRRACVAPIVMGLGSRARLFWDKEAGLMLEQWSDDTAASGLRRAHNGPFSAAPLEEALAC